MRAGASRGAEAGSWSEGHRPVEAGSRTETHKCVSRRAASRKHTSVLGQAVAPRQAVGRTITERPRHVAAQRRRDVYEPCDLTGVQECEISAGSLRHNGQVSDESELLFGGRWEKSEGMGLLSQSIFFHPRGDCELASTWASKPAEAIKDVEWCRHAQPCGG